MPELPLIEPERPSVAPPRLPEGVRRMHNQAARGVLKGLRCHLSLFWRRVGQVEASKTFRDPAHGVHGPQLALVKAVQVRKWGLGSSSGQGLK